MRDLSPGSKKSHHILKIAILSLLFLIVTVALIKFLSLEKKVIKGPQAVVQLITDTGLKNDEGRTNVLLLGIGGPGHEGPYLTDTMILASTEKEGKDVVLISIPRDLWVDSLSAKINSAYAYGIENNDGLDASKKAVEDTLGIPVHYTLRVDFGGFVKAVDLIEGLDLEVETAFTDPKYPISGKEDDTCGLTIETEEKDGKMREVVKDATGSATPLEEITDENNPFTCRYETVSFKKGPTHFDGTTALKFVRSRYGTNGEGSDFSRSARQQQVMLAFRQKVLSKETLTSPKTIIDLVETFGQTIDTDIASDDIPYFVKLFKKVNPAIVRKIVLDSDREESLLVVADAQSHKSQYALVPKNSTQELKNYLRGEIYSLPR